MITRLTRSWQLALRKKLYIIVSSRGNLAIDQGRLRPICGFFAINSRINKQNAHMTNLIWILNGSITCHILLDKKILKEFGLSMC